MSLFKCRMCGEEWEILEGAVTVECPHCGTMQAVILGTQDALEEKPAAAPVVSKSMKIILATVAVFVVAALVWYIMQPAGTGPEETPVTTNLSRLTAQNQKQADTTMGNVYGQNARLNLEEKAARGDPWAQYNLGEMYFTGQGAEKNLQEAVKWFRRSADQGHAEAQNRMGDACYNGWGVKKDYREAVNWYQRAATHESTRAQTALGTMYYNGTGVVKSYFNAVWWYSQAAETGNVWAQYYLGNMYRNGQGVKRDIEKARELYQKAAQQGHIGAMKALEHTKSLKLLGAY